MPRFILFGGVLTMLAAGALTLAFKLPRPATALHRAANTAPTDLIDPTGLTRQLRKLKEDGALP
jgi:hypothetical protein